VATSIGDYAFYEGAALTEVRLGTTPPATLGNSIFGDTRGSGAQSTRTITIAWPTGAGVESAYTAWWTTANTTTHWGATSGLPTGGIVLAASGYTP
jgi:hypothetical protein